MCETLVLQGALTLGGFQAFLLFGNMLISPVLTISAGVNTMQQGMACAERIYEFLDEAEEEKEDDSALDHVKNIGFPDIWGDEEED